MYKVIVFFGVGQRGSTPASLKDFASLHIFMYNIWGERESSL